MVRINWNIFDCLEQENFFKSFFIHFRLKNNDKWTIESNPITLCSKRYNDNTQLGKMKQNPCNQKSVQVKMSMSNFNKATNIYLKITRLRQVQTSALISLLSLVISCASWDHFAFDFFTLWFANLYCCNRFLFDFFVSFFISQTLLKLIKISFKCHTPKQRYLAPCSFLRVLMNQTS